MPEYSRPAIFARVVLLPLALTLGTIAGLGSYYETSDDGALAWLFAGVLAQKPVASLPLYFHGYGRGLAAAYTAQPRVPWFGLLNASLLGLATVYFFVVLDKLLRPHLRPLAIVIVLVVFFEVGWLEHWLWFSHVRVGLLLAGASVLYAAQRPGQRLALLAGAAGLGAAWLVRPSLALLGFGVVLPAAVVLAGSLRRAGPVIGVFALGLGIATGAASLLQTTDAAQTQARDQSFARVLDFNQLSPRPLTTADSLGTTGLQLWMMGDSTLINQALCQRAYRFDVTAFLGHTLPTKLSSQAAQLGRDYFPFLLALAATAVSAARNASRRKWFWLVQLGFISLLVFIAGFLKLPPRLGLPLLDFWLVTNLAILYRQTISSGNPRGHNSAPAFAVMSSTVSRAGLAVGFVVFLVYGVKTLHRRQVLAGEQAGREKALAAIARARAGRVCIMAGANDLVKGLSPFRAYALGAGPVLLLSGWPAHDASQARLRHALSGTTDQTECLRRLALGTAPAATQAPLWVLTPETAAWLSRRFRYKGARMLLVPGLAHPLPTDSALSYYLVQAWPTQPGQVSTVRLNTPMP